MHKDGAGGRPKTEPAATPTKTEDLTNEVKSLILEEEGVRYEIQTDRAIPTTGDRTGRSSVLPSSPHQLSIFSIAASPTEEAAYKKLSSSVTIGTVKSGLEKVTNGEEAAHVLAPFRKEGQEVMVALVTDKNDNILSVIHHTKGGIASNQIYFNTVLGSIHATENARNFWVGHNHPSGTTGFSSEDINLERLFKDASRNSGIVMRGFFVVTPTGETTISENGRSSTSSIKAIRRKYNIPVAGRKIVSVSKETPIKDSKDAIRVLGEKNGTGIMLLNSPHQPVAWIPMSVADMQTLRGGTAIHKLLKTAVETNANAMIAKFEGIAGAITAAENLVKFGMIHGIQLLDGVYGKDTIKSLSDEGTIRDITSRQDKNTAAGFFKVRESKQKRKDKYGPGNRTENAERLQRAVAKYTRKEIPKTRFTEVYLSDSASNFTRGLGKKR